MIKNTNINELLKLYLNHINDNLTKLKNYNININYIMNKLNNCNNISDIDKLSCDLKANYEVEKQINFINNNHTQIYDLMHKLVKLQDKILIIKSIEKNLKARSTTNNDNYKKGDILANFDLLTKNITFYQVIKTTKEFLTLAEINYAFDHKSPYNIKPLKNQFVPNVLMGVYSKKLHFYYKVIDDYNFIN